MGLGKTLSMLGLIASDLAVDPSDPTTATGVSAVDSSDRTLIVVPPPCKLAELVASNAAKVNSALVLIEWERQFKEYGIDTLRGDGLI